MLDALLRRLILLLATALLLGACTATGDAAWIRYHAAIADAAVAAPDKILPLQAVPATTTVPVVSWVTETRVPCSHLPCSFTVGSERLWVTLVGEVQGACRQWGLQGEALRLRLEQLLGLPPETPAQWRKSHFIVMQVDRANLERPCLGVETDPAGTPRCTLQPRNDNPAELRLFVLQQMGNAYVARNPSGPGYPFTRLGYTYDWNEEAAAHRHYGASEFVLKPGTVASVVTQISTNAYCQPAP